ncbi:chaoptin-like, partial [Armigeres subalbatus]|uniref:chaoptin-like n=1 Tax=Armigeres subalbatus TaxID=124917 RepID=UPI002ED52338
MSLSGVSLLAIIIAILFYMSRKIFHEQQRANPTGNEDVSDFKEGPVTDNITRFLPFHDIKTELQHNKLLGTIISSKRDPPIADSTGFLKPRRGQSTIERPHAGNAGLEYIVKLGYTLVIVTVGLMIWASLAKAREVDNTSAYSPCNFNVLCRCSKPGPDLGIVDCRNVHFPAIPKIINSSKLFKLYMDDTGLQDLEPYFFQATGLYKLDVSNNPITEIPDEAFFGLERSLWELVLENNELIEVPSRAIRELKKLRLLNLRGNDISSIDAGAFRGLEKSLQTLILSDNSISQLSGGDVTGLPNLDSIDLSGNNLAEIDPAAFKDGLDKLSKVYLGNNLLTHIPYEALQPLRLLRVLDLSYNLIRTLGPDDDGPKVNYKLTLDVLQLQYNSLKEIPSESFGFFDTINSTYLDGNPINNIEDNAFRQAKIRDLYIRHCGLDFISTGAFAGLESSLQLLDLSGNNLTQLADDLFKGFNYL